MQYFSGCDGVIEGKPQVLVGSKNMLWSYEIIPVGNYQPVDRGSFDSPTFADAKKRATTVPVLTAPPEYSEETDFEVRILDSGGKEVWRGAYVGSF
jgi:hypothetical protein